jgi:hypothetical protein
MRGGAIRHYLRVQFGAACRCNSVILVGASADARLVRLVMRLPASDANWHQQVVPIAPAGRSELHQQALQIAPARNAELHEQAVPDCTSNSARSHQQVLRDRTTMRCRIC